MKKNSLKTIISDVIESARPNTWLRVWGEMVVAAALASYPHFDFFSLFKTFIATSPLLWSAMYLLNDMTDIRLDKIHPLRSARPITQGRIRPKTAVFIITLLSLCAFAIGASINAWILILLIALSISQAVYTMPPVRCKERRFLDITINSVNSAIRFLLGFFSQKIIHPFPIYPLLLFVCIKVIFFIGHRLQNRKLELEMGIKSTVTLFGENQLKICIGLLFGLSTLFFMLSIITRDLPLSSLGATVLASIPFGGYFLIGKKRGLFLQEKTLEFRNMLYLEYFLITNLIALTIIYR